VSKISDRLKQNEVEDKASYETQRQQLNNLLDASKAYQKDGKEGLKAFLQTRQPKAEQPDETSENE
jgi:malate synthase